VKLHVRRSQRIKDNPWPRLKTGNTLGKKTNETKNSQGSDSVQGFIHNRGETRTNILVRTQVRENCWGHTNSEGTDGAKREVEADAKKKKDAGKMKEGFTVRMGL